MTVSLKIWTSPKTGEVRVYANAFREGRNSEFAYADGAYFVADDDGLTKIGGFKPCMSGNYGRSAHAIRDAFGMAGMPFAELLERITAAQTDGGNFSEVRYFKNLKALTA